MRDYRLKALKIYQSKPVPTWGANLEGLRDEDIYFFVKPASEEAKSWEDVPQNIKRTFDRLGIPEAEQNSWPGPGRSMTRRWSTTRSKKNWKTRG